MAYVIVTNIVCTAAARALFPTATPQLTHANANVSSSSSSSSSSQSAHDGGGGVGGDSTVAGGAEPVGRAAWFGVTAGAVALCFLLSNMLPFLADLMAVISAVCALATTYVVLARSLPRLSLLVLSCSSTYSRLTPFWCPSRFSSGWLSTKPTTRYVFPCAFALLLLGEGEGGGGGERKQQQQQQQQQQRQLLRMPGWERLLCKVVVVLALVMSVLGVYAALVDIAKQMGKQSRSAFSC